MTSFVDALTTLRTRLIDSREGYKEALEQSGTHDLTALFREMYDLRMHDIAPLGAALVAAGQPADPDGSFMSTVNRTIMYVRAKVTGLDEGVLGGVIDGERRILQLYDTAIETASGEPSFVVLHDQRTRLAAKLHDLQAWHDRIRDDV